MPASLRCITQSCGEHFGITDVLYNCPKCGGLLEAAYDFSRIDAPALKRLWRERRMSNAPLEQSGVWRYRELFPFLGGESSKDQAQVVTLREGNTPLLNA